MAALRNSSERLQNPPSTGAAMAPDAERRPRWSFRVAAAHDASIVERLWPGAVVLAGAILVTALDQAYSAASGEVFTPFGLRTSVAAGVLMLVGLGLCVYRLKRD
jgi:hypothetical protein